MQELENSDFKISVAADPDELNYANLAASQK